jgi:TonB family protein
VKYRILQPVRLSKLASFPFSALVLLLCLIASWVPQILAQNAPKPHRKVIVMYDPEYPAIMKNGHFEGQVRVEATVLATGAVSKVEIKGGNPILAQCAAEAVAKWKYAPGPAQSIEEITFTFNADKR